MQEIQRKSTPARVALPHLPAAVFQHPLDKQATENLKKIKGFEWIVEKIIDYGFERIEYIRNIGGAVRIGPGQMPKHYAMLQECCRILDVEEPELYVMQGGVNAYTSGHRNPFIVLQTGLLELLEDDEEVMAVIAHELGHIKCEHVLYKTMARNINALVDALGRATLGIGSLFGTGFEMALLAWDRRSELSADRASMLVIQKKKPCIMMLMKLAGGTVRCLEEMSFEQFLNQARTYKEGMDNKLASRFYRFLVTMSQNHPFPVERARALDEWFDSEEYKNILTGKYYPDSLPAENITCPSCGKNITQQNARFCLSCGAPLLPH